MDHNGVRQADRRKETRRPPATAVRVRRAVPVLPITDAEVLNTSRGGLALRTKVPMKPGDRLSFTTDASRPPILAEVLGSEPLDGATFRVRCRCLLGGFELS